ncbi:MAG: AI-2E family transporter [Caldilineaceae bacterium]|nr:AI-2E family transporter [Caldilineaceae bacterium]
MSSRKWGTATKIVVASILALLTIILLITFRVMIAPTIVALLLAFILSYPVNWVIRRTGWQRGVTIGLFYLAFFAVAALALALFIPRFNVAESINSAVNDLIAGLQAAGNSPILVIGPYELSADLAFQQLSDMLQGLVVSTGNPFSFFRSFTTGILTVFYVLVLNFWLLKDWPRFQREAIERVPTDYQEDVRRLSKELASIWDSFLRGQFLLAVVVGVIMWILLAILGMPNRGGLALLAGFMEFLPTIGPGISIATGTIFALFRGSEHAIFGNNITFALITLLAYNCVTWFESAYLIPRLVGSRVRLHPAVTFVSIISGALAFGLLGVLLATPVVASARVLLSYIYSRLSDRNPFSEDEDKMPAVRIRGLVAGRKIEGVIFDLDGTLTELDWHLARRFVEKTDFLDFLMKDEQRMRIAQRFMISAEGNINRLERLDLVKKRAGIQSTLDGLRGHPPGQALCLQPGIKETLHTLAREYKLGLVTTRPFAEVDQFLKRSELHDGPFQAVITQEDVRNVLPNNEAILLAATKMGIEPSAALMVCDSDGNLRSASASGLATAAVTSGLSRLEDFSYADLILTTPNELTEWL